jgi:hypothetical protein
MIASTRHTWSSGAVAAAFLATVGCPPPPPVPQGWSSEATGPAESTTLPRSCVGAPAASRPGVVTIDPDGDERREPFDVYCDVDGWILVGEVGSNSDIMREAFTMDRQLAALLDPQIAREGVANYAFERFEAYGATWTLRTVVSDPEVAPAWTQQTFFRGRDGEIVDPNELGNNWFMKSTPSRLETLTYAATGASQLAGSTNQTWVPVGPYDWPTAQGAPPASTFYMFGQYDADPLLNGQTCIDDDGQTARCRLLAGMLNDEQGFDGKLGVPSGLQSYRDGTDHSWGRAASYWLRDDRPPMPQTIR